jgi:hypothetical protein
LLKDKLSIGYDRIKSAVEKCKVRYPEFDLMEVANACAKDKKNLDDKVSIMLADFQNTKEVKLSVKEIYGGLEQWKLNR